MIRFLRDHVHIATVGEDLVCLDVAAGTYACALGLGEAVGRPDAQGRVDIASHDAAEALAKAGLVVDHAQAAGRRRTAPPPLPTLSAWRAAQAAVKRADQCRMAGAYGLALRRYFGRPFASVMAFAARGASPGATAPLCEVGHDAQVFDQLLPYAPFQGECLLRSFMLLMFLRLAGRNARWVLGVQTYPFQAHCWLQAGDTVLDDAAERVCGYTPIFAV